MELDTADSARACLALSMSSSAILAERSSCAGLPPSIFGNLPTGTVTHSLQITSLFRSRGRSGSKAESWRSALLPLLIVAMMLLRLSSNILFKTRRI